MLEIVAAPEPVQRTRTSARVRDAVPTARIDPAHGGAARAGEGHPLVDVIPLLRDTLLSIADEAQHIMIITDARGNVLWREGAEGGAAGAHPAEHHSWSCAAAPIHDPDSHVVIGAIDIAGPERLFHPTTLALVGAAAQLAEGHLAALFAMRDERLLARNLSRLLGLRDGPGALLAPTGRVLAAVPYGWLPSRVTLPGAGDRVRLGASGEGVLEPLAEGWLLRLLRPVTRRPAPALPGAGWERPRAWPVRREP